MANRKAAGGNLTAILTAINHAKGDQRKAAVAAGVEALKGRPVDKRCLRFMPGYLNLKREERAALEA